MFQEIPHALNSSFGSVQLVLMKKLNMSGVTATICYMPLSQEQKGFFLSILLELCDCTNSGRAFLQSLIAGGKSGTYGYDPEMKMQSSH
jgi:hypothetical protein